MPRPSLKTPELIEEVLSRLSKGEPLAAICRDEGMPVPTTWNAWCREDESLGIAHAHARDDGFDAIAADALRIIDEEPERILTGDEDGGSISSRRDSASVQWAKNRFEARLKLLAKWDPRRYGDKQLVGSDPENPLPAGFSINLVKPK